jgi:7,8-dihydropterin-6-yl-methyl-4-(beta-D-ribofuranosyl)aminobenzene 5'-phosphate synthase
MRYYDGKPPEVMTFGTAWQGANFEPIERTTEVAPGICDPPAAPGRRLSG